MLCQPCILGVPQTKGQEIRIGCLTPSFSRAQKRGQMLSHPCILGDPPTKGDEIRIGCLTPTFSGAQKRAQVLHHRCIRGDPQTKGDKISCGYLSTSRVHSPWSPNKGKKSKMVAWGRRTKVCICNPKKKSPKFFSQKWCVFIEEHP